MNATYMAENGSEQPYIMGCYGIGVTRSMAAVVEQRNDEHGIAWPVSIAPAEVIVLPLQTDVDKVMSTAACLAEKLEERGVSVAIDDRDARAGVKFADADLIGWPLQIIVGNKGIEAGELEFKVRDTGVRSTIPAGELTAKLDDAYARLENIKIGSEDIFSNF